VETRLSVVWLGLLGVLESADAMTTAMDRARGSIESMPLSALLLNAGGMGLFLTLKLALVAGAAIALWLSLQWLRSSRAHARAIYVFVLSAIRMGSVAIAIASLNNALLLRSLG
jgi:hypothetical protein